MPNITALCAILGMAGGSLLIISGLLLVKRDQMRTNRRVARLETPTNIVNPFDKAEPKIKTLNCPFCKGSVTDLDEVTSPQQRIEGDPFVGCLNPMCTQPNARLSVWQKMYQVKICECVYEGPHGIEMIKDPSGKEWAIGGTDRPNRWKWCPYCGGAIPNPDKEDKCRLE